MSRQTLGCLTVIKAETYVAVKAPRPCVEPIALTADERVERVEKKGPYTFQRAALYRALSGQPVEDGNHEAFRFPRSRAAADDGGGRLLPAKSFPGFKLVCVRPARRRELVVLPQFLGRLVEAAGQAFIQQVPCKVGHAEVCLFPAEHGFKCRVACETSFITRRTGEHGVQTAAQRIIV